MSLYVGPDYDDNNHDLVFDQPCRFGYEECSDTRGGICTLPEVHRPSLPRHLYRIPLVASKPVLP